MYSLKLANWALQTHPDHYGPLSSREIRISCDGSKCYLEAWLGSLGTAPTPEYIETWTPTSPDPDKAPAPSLEIRDYKALDAALEAASTVAQVKAVFRAYLRRRAGL